MTDILVLPSKASQLDCRHCTKLPRQLTDSCRRPVFNGFEATGHFLASDERDEDHSHLSMYACAPYGYYELEIRVDGPDSLQGIQCYIEAGSKQVIKPG